MQVEQKSDVSVVATEIILTFLESFFKFLRFRTLRIPVYTFRSLLADHIGTLSKLCFFSVAAHNAIDNAPVQIRKTGHS